MEVLTLVQTRKIKKHLPIVLFGKGFWEEVLHFEPLQRYGTISPEDTKLFFRTDSVDEAFDFLVRELKKYSVGDPSPTM
jgi:hypothetical protein